MKKVILLALLVPGMASGQIMENFESAGTVRWIQIPEGRWSADNTFRISGEYSLHHSFDNPAAGIDRIAISLENLHPEKETTRWSFRIRHGYDPSSSNNWAVFLMTDSDPSQSGTPQPNGFVTGVNLTGYDDTLRLWKIKKGVYIPLVNSCINWQNDIGPGDAVEIAVERSQEGHWRMSVFRLNGDSVCNSSVSDPELFTPGWLVVSYKYTATRDMLLWLDDISVDGNFETNGGNISALTGRADVIITEIMADPTPAVSLPEKEYFEIRNRTSIPISMSGWSLLAGDQKISFPDVTIMPQEYRIITPAKDTASFSKYGKVDGMRSFPPLTDGGTMLALISNTGELVHGVEYSRGWYGSGLKAGGGWSLEMIDIDYPFHYRENWKASTSRSGGTPGACNSVSKLNRDTYFCGIVNVFPDDSQAVTISFSEPVFDVTGENNGIMINGGPVADIKPADPLMRAYSIIPGNILEQGKIYTLTVPEDLSDVSGNKAEVTSFSFGIPEQAITGDVIFNELLFNPLPGDPDYIELFNNSGKTVDASRLLLVSVNSSGDTSSVYQLSGEHRCILPGSYYVITTDREKIVATYSHSDPSVIFETGSLPSMPDDKGHLLLLNRELDLIDEVYYSDDMHYSLLADTEGVALERYTPGSVSGERSGWHSAAETTGWGTPGRPNSIVTEEHVDRDNAVLSSTKISPDNDGFEDILVINLTLTGNENVVSVRIYDETGSLVNRLADNLMSGPHVSIIWNGTLMDGTIAGTGIYIILITVFDDTGKTIRFKKACTVLR